MTRLVVEEVDGVFVLPIAGFVCRRREGEKVIAVDGSGVEAELPVLDDVLAVDLVGRRARVERATVSHESTLRIEFDGGAVLVIPAGEYEAWEVSVADGNLYAVAPAGGGEPAIWDESSPTYTIRSGEPLPSGLGELLGAMENEFGEDVEVRETKGDSE